MTDAKLLTIDELAAALGVKSSWVMEKGAKGEIPSYRLGKYRRFKLDEVLAALRDDEQGEAA